MVGGIFTFLPLSPVILLWKSLLILPSHDGICIMLLNYHYLISLNNLHWLVWCDELLNHCRYTYNWYCTFLLSIPDTGSYPSLWSVFSFLSICWYFWTYSLPTFSYRSASCIPYWNHESFHRPSMSSSFYPHPLLQLKRLPVLW